MTDAEKLAKLLDLVDEYRRVETIIRRPPNAHEARQLAEAQSKLDTFVSELQTEVFALPAIPPAPSRN